MNDDFSPLETIQLAMRKWWLIALLMILGGLFGILFYQLRQPVYEATVAFSMGIDYTRTGPISQYDGDHALGMAGTLISSTRIKEEVISTARENGFEIEFDSLHENSFLERKAHVWILRVQSEDPATAASLANFWAEIALRELTNAYQHALEKEKLERYGLSLVNCLEMTVSTQPISAPCQFGSMRSLQEEITLVQANIMEEKQASYNIFPGLLFGEVSKAVVPTDPVRYGRGSLALAGMVIGFTIALLLIHIPRKQRRL